MKLGASAGATVGDKDSLANFDYTKARIPQGDKKSDLDAFLTNDEFFRLTCVEWPQNIPPEQQRLGETGGCCWQFVDDGN